VQGGQDGPAAYRPPHFALRQQRRCPYDHILWYSSTNAVCTYRSEPNGRGVRSITRPRTWNNISWVQSSLLNGNQRAVIANVWATLTIPWRVHTTHSNPSASHQRSAG